MSKHIVAIIGGACAGSEMANQLTSNGIDVVIFEQNALPYGKIEDGLPRWHAKLQNREIDKIDSKLAHESVQFVPFCKLGKDITLSELIDAKFSAIVLASGAWKDRPLRADGLNEVNDSSFCYQNALIYWFNHYHEKNYDGITYPVTEGAAVIGGGLASIDVAKICQLRTTQAKLKERGIEVDILELEHIGIAKFLAKHELKYADLGIKPARLYYRRRDIDMPLATMPDGCTPEKAIKVQNVRKKILDNANKKYFFEVCPLHLPKEIHSENGKVCGITFHKMKYDGDKLEQTEEEIYVETQFIVSSIGSIPEPIEGIPMKWETYEISDTTTGAINKYEGLYGVGNAVTGKGNINVSHKHAKQIGSFVSSSLTKTNEEEIQKYWEKEEEKIADKMREIYSYLQTKETLGTDEYQKLNSLVTGLQEKCNYDNYNAWKEKIIAPRN